jgi:hypothetical protein
MRSFYSRRMGKAVTPGGRHPVPALQNGIPGDPGIQSACKLHPAGRRLPSPAPEAAPKCPRAALHFREMG